MRWYKTRCLTSLKAHEDMGMESAAEYRTCIIDLDEIEAFMDDEDHEDNPCTQIKFKSGESFSIEIPVDDFEGVMGIKYGQ
jgi:hypothetical protein